MSASGPTSIPAREEDLLGASERKRLISLAYGYLGSLAESEDVVQEAYVRFAEATAGEIRNFAAWLTTVVTRLCLDRLRSAQNRREVYPGEWLPEPLYAQPDPEQAAITRSRLSVGLLYMLDKLEPEQRVVFVLREVFEYDYRAISGILGKSEAACRQLMARARNAVGSLQSETPVPPEAVSHAVAEMLDALARGDERKLLTLLAPHAVLVTDGGGKVPSTRNPVFGADRIARFFLGIRRKSEEPYEFRAATVNGGPGMLTFQSGRLVAVTSFALLDTRIAAIYAVSNPDKLRGESSPSLSAQAKL